MKMSLQVLLSTMHQQDHGILDKMNISSDAVVVNQCAHNKFEDIVYKGHNIRFLSFQEKGVGLSRNNALMRATADICLFADEDEVFVDEYEQLICLAFIQNPKADIILFNVPSLTESRPSPHNDKIKRVHFFNCLKYGAVSIAIRLKKLRKSNLSFTLLFGGGAKYGSGEDSLFLLHALKKKLKIYTCPTVIASVSCENSTWFKGYDEQFFRDKGAFYAAVSFFFAHLFCLVQVLRHRKEYCNALSLFQVYRLMCQGIKEFRSLK